VSIEAEGLGGRLETNQSPRSATGPDLNYLVVASGDAVARVNRLTLRVKRMAQKPVESAWETGTIHAAAGALGELVHEMAFFSAARFYSGGPAGINRLVITGDAADGLGMERIAHCCRVVGRQASCSFSDAAGCAGAPFWPRESGSVEVYAPYSGAEALDEAAAVLFDAGSTGAWLYRYGREGISLRFRSDAGGALDKVAAKAGKVVWGAGGRVVHRGGALLTGADCAITRAILGRITSR
jgi:hypothetical protein